MTRIQELLAAGVNNGLKRSSSTLASWSFLRRITSSRSGDVKEIYEVHGRGRSARGIARDLGLARNMVLRYLNSPEAMLPKPRLPRGSRLDSHTEHIDRRLAEGLENCVVLLRELRARRYRGSCTILVEYVRPRRRGRQPEATMRFETAPGEQAQVDWGSLPYVGEDGKLRRVRVFVMTMGWSRACYVGLVRRADTAAFIQCHANAFEHLGGVPRRCLYDNAKVVTLGRDEDGQVEWNPRMLDFALRVGFEIRLCQPYRAQTKGKVESGVKYVRRNMWPSLRFTDDARPEPAGPGVVRRGVQRQSAWHDLPDTVGDAGRGANPPGPPALPAYPGAIRLRLPALHR